MRVRGIVQCINAQASAEMLHRALALKAFPLAHKTLPLFVSSGEQVVQAVTSGDGGGQGGCSFEGAQVMSAPRSPSSAAMSSAFALSVAETVLTSKTQPSNAALQIRQRIAQLRGSNRQALQASVGATLRPARIISPVYGAPMEVTAGAVQAMKQADLINQVLYPCFVSFWFSVLSLPPPLQKE